MLNTARAKIGKFSNDDIEAAYEYLSDIDVMKYIEPPFDHTTTGDFIEKYGATDTPSVYAITDIATSKIIGHLIFHPFDDEDSYEFGCIIKKEYWGKGLAFEIGVAIINYSFNILRIKRLIAETVENNQASIRLIKKLGLEFSHNENGLMVFQIENSQTNT